VRPRRLSELGFGWRFPTLDGALQEILPVQKG